MKIYGSAFERNSTTFKPWIEDLVKGESKVNSKTLYPYEIVRQVSANASKEQSQLLEAMWDSLPDYFDGSTRSVLPIIDVSGSMESPVSGSTSATCMNVAIGLGMYCAERTRGAFRNKFITFHSQPTLISIPNPKYYNLCSRVDTVRRAPWEDRPTFRLRLILF